MKKCHNVINLQDSSQLSSYDSPSRSRERHCEEASRLKNVKRCSWRGSSAPQTQDFGDDGIAAGLDPVDYDMLGDKLYLNAQNICRLYKEPMNDQARVDNAIDSSVRACVEWSNNCISSRWMSLAFKRRLQIQLSDVKRQAVVGAILTNAYTLLHGCQTMNNFYDVDNPLTLEMPSLEEYFEVAWGRLAWRL